MEEADKSSRVLKRKLAQLQKERDTAKSELTKAQASVVRLQRERVLLMDKLLENDKFEYKAHHHHSLLEGYDSESVAGTDVSDSDLSDDDTTNPSASQSNVSLNNVSSPMSHSQPTTMPFPAFLTSSVATTAATASASPSGPAAKKASEKRASGSAVIKRPAKKIPYVPHVDGKPVLPIKIGVLSLTNLGRVEYKNPAFHNNRYIWPVGYQATRQYSSMLDPSKSTDYDCKIIENNGQPAFVITPQDDREHPIVSATATGAWTTVLRMANKVRNREGSNSASGPDYFGFSNPTIAKLIQDLPNADKCVNYVWQDYVMPEGPPSRKRARNRSSSSSASRRPASSSATTAGGGAAALGSGGGSALKHLTGGDSSSVVSSSDLHDDIGDNYDDDGGDEDDDPNDNDDDDDPNNNNDDDGDDDLGDDDNLSIVDGSP